MANERNPNQPDDLSFDPGEWSHGPPHEIFRRMRAECPIHRTETLTQYPDEAGFWSVTRAEDIRAVSLDWQTYSSERGGISIVEGVIPVEVQRLMFIAMDPPRHDRIKELFQRGFTPKRIAEHEEPIRAIVRDVLERAPRRCNLVEEVAQPVVSRVISRFMGIPPEDDALWARLANAVLAADDPDANPAGVQAIMEEILPEIFEHAKAMIADRRAHPSDDLTSILVHAEIDGEGLSDDEIIMGLFLLLAAGNDSTKATYCSAMRALFDHPEQKQLLLDDPTLIPSAVEESLRMFPAFTNFRRTATRDTELGGIDIREGDKLALWYVSSNRDEDVFDEPNRFDIRRQPNPHQAFGGGGRHFCLGAALARLELKILLEETLAHYPDIALDGEPRYVSSGFVNQLKELPVCLAPEAS